MSGAMRAAMASTKATTERTRPWRLAAVEVETRERMVGPAKEEPNESMNEVTGNGKQG